MNLRNFVIWGVIVVVLIGLYSRVTGGGKAAGASEISYSQLLSKVDAGEVKSALFRGSTVEIHDHANKTFTSTAAPRITACFTSPAFTLEISCE